MKQLQNNSQETTGLLEEYKTLRAELISTQGQRLQIVAYTVGALSVLLSLFGGALLKPSEIPHNAQLFASILGSIVAYAVLIPSEMLMISAQRHIHRIARYIAVFIEPKIPGLAWETRWSLHTYKLKHPGGLRGMSSIYFGLSLLPLLLPIYVLSRSQFQWQWTLILLPFLVVCLYLAYDLRTARSKNWRSTSWDSMSNVEREKL
jgi:Ca2+/Na+ antiporter